MSKDVRIEELRKNQKKNKWSSLARYEKWTEEVVDIKLYGQAVAILGSTVKSQAEESV